jgi:hypothetical protein
MKTIIMRIGFLLARSMAVVGFCVGDSDINIALKPAGGNCFPSVYQDIVLPGRSSLRVMALG